MSTAGEWLRGEGPHHQIVISSRVRLARNLRDRAFPGWAKKAERTAILEMIKPRVEELPEMQDSFSELLQDLSAMEKQVLVERHLISREHAAKGVGSGVVMNRKQTLSVMINEEDHLRMQSIRSGLQLKQAFKLVDKIDSALESKLEFAYDQRLGYLTACPTNVGTGMRASAMLHLPGLVLSELINQVIQAVSKIGAKFGFAVQSQVYMKIGFAQRFAVACWIDYLGSVIEADRGSHRHFIRLLFHPASSCL